MLCCSVRGEKLKPLVIGNSRKPRCFKNLDVESLPVTWKSNRKSWMTNVIFTEWAKDINRQMRKKSRKIMIFVDNATSHNHNLKLTNVEFRFLPPNTTAKLQPLDLGIIRAFKARYRKHMIKHLLTQIDTCESASELCKNVNVLKAIHWTVRSWNETKTSTIESCFRDAGFPLDASLSSEVEDTDDDIPLNELVQCLRSSDPSVSHDDIEEFDDNLITESIFDDEWESDLLREFTRDTISSQSLDNETDSEDEVNSESIPLPGSEMNDDDVMKMLINIRNFALAKNSRYLSNIEELVSVTEDAIVKNKSAMRQSTMDDFLMKTKI